MIKTPEVVKVYIGSFWDEPLKNEETEALIKREMADFLRDLNDLNRWVVFCFGFFGQQ